MDYELRTLKYNVRTKKQDDESVGDWKKRQMDATPKAKLQFRIYEGRGHWTAWTDFPTEIETIDLDSL